MKYVPQILILCLFSICASPTRAIAQTSGRENRTQKKERESSSNVKFPKNLAYYLYGGAALIFLGTGCLFGYIKWKESQN